MLNVFVNVRFVVFFIVFCVKNEVHGQCTERANLPSQTVSSPFECATDKYVFLTKPVSKVRVAKYMKKYVKRLSLLYTVSFTFSYK